MALGIWLLLVIVYDTALLGLLVADDGRVVTPGLFGALLLLNPTDAFRLLNLAGFADARLVAGLAGVDAGPAGHPAAALGALAAWVLLPLGLDRLAARQEGDMKLRALLVAAGARRLRRRGAGRGPPPREPGPGDVGHYCGMNLVDHPGPKAQIFLASRNEPVWFTQVRDAIAFTRLPEEPRDITAIWVNDMGRTTNWAAARGRRLGRGAQRLVRHRQRSRAGGMGAAEAVPFGTSRPRGPSRRRMAAASCAWTRSRTTTSWAWTPADAGADRRMRTQPATRS